MNSPSFDLESAANALETVVVGVTDDQLDLPSPSPERTVRVLIAHIAGFAEGFRQGATKEGIGNSQPPTDAGAALADDWRDRIPVQLKALVAAWRDPAAWEGETEVGGVRAPSGQMALFTLDELVIHGWDLAVATSQPYRPDPADVAILLEMMRDNPPEGTPGLFGPVIPTPESASAFARVLGLTGRDPNWTP